MEKEIYEKNPDTSRVDYVKLTKQKAARGRVISGVVYATLILWALIVLFPFYWMIITALKPTDLYNAEIVPRLYAAQPTFENFIGKITENLNPVVVGNAPKIYLGNLLLTTLTFALDTTVLMLLIIIPASYAFSRLRFRGKELVFTLVLSLMMIPSELVIVTNFVTVANLGLKNTLMGLVIPSVTSIFYIYLLKENFSQIPDQLYYAAKVDGTSDFKYMYKVLVPICKPTLISIAILKFVECWNSYAWPAVITTDKTKYMVSQGIDELINNAGNRGDHPGMMAAAVIISIPLIILFLVFRKKIMEGVAKGGTKG